MNCPSCNRPDTYVISFDKSYTLFGCNCGRAFGAEVKR